MLKSHKVVLKSKDFKDMENSKVLLKDVSICPLFSSSKNSYGWKYFGKLTNPQLKDNRVYCTKCFEVAQKKSKKGTDLFER